MISRTQDENITLYTVKRDGFELCALKYDNSKNTHCLLTQLHENYIYISPRGKYFATRLTTTDDYPYGNGPINLDIYELEGKKFIKRIENSYGGIYFNEQEDTMLYIINGKIFSLNLESGSSSFIFKAPINESISSCSFTEDNTIKVFTFDSSYYSSVFYPFHKTVYHLDKDYFQKINSIHTIQQAGELLLKLKNKNSMSDNFKNCVLC